MPRDLFHVETLSEPETGLEHGTSMKLFRSFEGNLGQVACLMSTGRKGACLNQRHVCAAVFLKRRYNIWISSSTSSVLNAYVS